METSSEFITISDRTNQKMIDHIVSRTEELIKPKHSLSTAKILIYGITYKKDVADTRDSAALKIIEQFKQKGACLAIMTHISLQYILDKTYLRIRI